MATFHFRTIVLTDLAKHSIARVWPSRQLRIPPSVKVLYTDTTHLLRVTIPLPKVVHINKSKLY